MNSELLHQICAEPNRTIRKFKLIKTFGRLLRERGIRCNELSAAQIEHELRTMVDDDRRSWNER